VCSLVNTEAPGVRIVSRNPTRGQLPIEAIVRKPNQDDDHWQIGLLPVGNIFRLAHIFKTGLRLGRICSVLTGLHLGRAQAPTDQAWRRIAQINQAINACFGSTVALEKEAHGVSPLVHKRSTSLPQDLLITDLLRPWTHSTPLS